MTLCIHISGGVAHVNRLHSSLIFSLLWTKFANSYKITESPWAYWSWASTKTNKQNHIFKNWKSEKKGDKKSTTKNAAVISIVYTITTYSFAPIFMQPTTYHTERTTPYCENIQTDISPWRQNYTAETTNPHPTFLFFRVYNDRKRKYGALHISLYQVLPFSFLMPFSFYLRYCWDNDALLSYLLVVDTFLPLNLLIKPNDPFHDKQISCFDR